MIEQMLFDLGPTFKGATVEAQDVPRLTSQLERVRSVVSDGRWHTIPELTRLAAPGSESAISARLRDLRREGYTVERERVSGGLFRYRVV